MVEFMQVSTWFWNLGLARVGGSQLKQEGEGVGVGELNGQTVEFARWPIIWNSYLKSRYPGLGFCIGPTCGMLGQVIRTCHSHIWASQLLKGVAFHLRQPSTVPVLPSPTAGAIREGLRDPNQIRVEVLLQYKFSSND